MISTSKINAKHKELMNIVQKELSCSAHSLDHVLRVYNLCVYLSKYENDVDVDILYPAALLHDIARVKESADKTGNTDHAVLGSQMAEDILINMNYSQDNIDKIKHCIVTHRFRSGNEPQSIEAKVLFDADKLDAIGAVGIARCFMISGKYGQRLYNDTSLNEYLSNNSVENGRLKDLSKHTPFIEFEMKFKKIPNRLYTKKGREVAEERVNYMKGFFEKLREEIEGL